MTVSVTWSWDSQVQLQGQQALWLSQASSLSLEPILDSHCPASVHNNGEKEFISLWDHLGDARYEL